MIPPEFLTAWPQMPAMLEAIANGTIGNIGTASMHTIVEEFLDTTIAERRDDPDHRNDRRVQVFDWMEQTDPDMQNPRRAGEVDAAKK